MALPDDCWQLDEGHADAITLSEPLLTANDVGRLLGIEWSVASGRDMASSS
jgi:hypothetical protein